MAMLINATIRRLEKGLATHPENKLRVVQLRLIVEKLKN
jgi:hypothetical protein